MLAAGSFRTAIGIDNSTVEEGLHPKRGIEPLPGEDRLGLIEERDRHPVLAQVAGGKGSPDESAGGKRSASRLPREFRGGQCLAQRVLGVVGGGQPGEGFREQKRSTRQRGS